MKLLTLFITVSVLVNFLACGILNPDFGTNIEIKNETDHSNVEIYLNGKLKATLNRGKSTKFGVEKAKSQNLSAQTSSEILAETVVTVIEGTFKLLLICEDISGPFDFCYFEKR